MSLHRVPHEVTLLRDQLFPRCARCQDAVVFRLLQAANEEPDWDNEFATRIYLYELPVLDEDEAIAV